jgi:hypothetical protein
MKQMSILTVKLLIFEYIYKKKEFLYFKEQEQLRQKLLWNVKREVNFYCILLIELYILLGKTNDGRSSNEKMHS